MRKPKLDLRITAARYINIIIKSWFLQYHIWIIDFLSIFNTVCAGFSYQTTSNAFHFPDFCRQTKITARITQSQTMATAMPITPM